MFPILSDFLEVLMKESKFQSDLIKELHEQYPDAIIMKTDANYIQGFPDLLILKDNKWAALECKRSSNAHRQPNQDYYISKLNDMSFASYISKENKKEVLDELQRSFKV